MMESAEHEMLRSLGISVLPKTEDGSHPLTWPRVGAECQYQAAARFEDLLQITIRVASIGSTSVQYKFGFTRDGQPIANGKLTVVCCKLTPAGLSKTSIPEDIRGLLQKHT